MSLFFTPYLHDNFVNYCELLIVNYYELSRTIVTIGSNYSPLLNSESTNVTNGCFFHFRGIVLDSG